MKKVIALLLMFIIISVSACSASVTDISGTTTATESETGSGTGGRLEPDLEKRDFEGQTFTFLTTGPQWNANNYCISIYAGEVNGETINDVVWQRNLALEARYNFAIAEIQADSSNYYLSDTLQKNVLSADDAYQAAVMTNDDCARAVMSGNLYDLWSLDFIDTSMPWWDSSMAESSSLGGKLYYAVGDIDIMANNGTWAVFFNKKLIADLNITTPYDYVSGNEWILDNYYTLSVAGASDLNGDGKMGYGDRFGMVGEYLNTFIFYIGSGERLTDKDGDDRPVLCDLNTRSTSALEKIFDIAFDTNRSTAHAQDYKNIGANPYEAMLRASFRADNALFYVAGILSFTLLRDMESEYGMVPVPKYDSDQTEYYSTTNPFNDAATAIPLSNQSPDDTAFVLEAMAAESMYTLRPAYYDTALQRKYMRDEESAAMLDIIFGNRVQDLSFVYNWGNLGSLLTTMTQKRSRDFASEYEKVKNNAQKAIDTLIESIEAQ